jgi:hypothetical protein
MRRADLPSSQRPTEAAPCKDKSTIGEVKDNCSGFLPNNLAVIEENTIVTQWHNNPCRPWGPVGGAAAGQFLTELRKTREFQRASIDGFGNLFALGRTSINPAKCSKNRWIATDSLGEPRDAASAKEQIVMMLNNWLDA